MTVIYKIISPTNKIYIGQSINYERRLITYKRLLCKSQKVLYNSFLKHGIDNHKFEIIKKLPDKLKQSVIDSYEIYYISLYKKLNYKLLNLTEGGKGCKGYIFTIKDKLKLSNSRKGYKASNDTKEKMSNYSKNRTKLHLEKLGKSRSKPLFQYDLEGNFIKEWKSLLEATTNLKGDIKACAKGKQYTAGGYIWEYKDLASKNIKEKAKEIKELLIKNNKIRSLNISKFYSKNI